MKHLFAILLLLLGISCHAQRDTIVTTSGNLFTSIMKVENDGRQLRITDLKGRVWPIDKEFVDRVVLGDTIRSAYGWSFYSSKGSSDISSIESNDTSSKGRNVTAMPKLENAKPIDLHTELAGKRDHRDYLKAAGAWGIGGTVLMIGGIVTTVVSLAVDNETIAYAGAGMSGAGLILYIPAFTNLLKAGKLRQP